MTVEEMHQRKAELEHALRDKLTDFCAETGVKFLEIRLHWYEYRRLEDAQNQRMLTRVEVEVSL